MRYDPIRKRVTQILGTLSYDDLEGDFGAVINKLMIEHESYKKFMIELQPITEKDYRGGAYLDGSSVKSVKFDKVYLEWQRTYDDERELKVIGERPYDASELEAFKLNLKDQEEREKAKLRELKEKYPDV